VRLVWITDPHLNSVTADQARALCARANSVAPDAVVVTGDIATAATIGSALGLLRDALEAPLYFVLGNHDFYGGSVARVRAAVRQHAAAASDLVYLSVAGVCGLSERTCLVGHDGWADGRFGDWRRSTLPLNDYWLIDDLRDRRTRLETMQRLAEEAASHLRAVLPEALATYADVVVATHVPPFREASRHAGAVADDNGLPHFSSRVVGEALSGAALAFPDRRLTVLCGHTHSAAEVAVLPNLTVLAGAAAYGAPAVQRVLELP
jgi:3',5'-cyclic AMP phosphodiesterase CpdA